MTEVQETIKFNAVNVLDGVTGTLEVFPHQKISEIRPQIEEALELFGWDFGDNEETTWCLYSQSYSPDSFLGDNQLVKDVIRPGDTVEASPTLVAGGD